MATTDTGGATIATMVGNYYDKVFLDRLESNLVYDKNGVQAPLPANQGNTVVWHALLNPAKGALITEGTNPTALAVSARKVSAPVLQYGAVKSITDLVNEMAVCPVVKETVAALGYSAALTKDSLISDQIGFGSAASTGVVDATSVALPSAYSRGFPLFNHGDTSAIWTSRVALKNGLFSATLSIGAIRRAVTYLKGLDAMPFEDGNYRAVIDPLISDQIRADTTFATWMAYTNRAAMEKGKLGVIERVLFEESSQAIKVPVLNSTWSGYASGGTSLYGTLIHGKGAYGVTKLSGRDAKIQVVTGADHGDALNLTTLIGYKLTMAVAILNPSAGIIIPWMG